MTAPQELQHRIAIRDVGVQGERRRIVGIVLAEYARYKAEGKHDIAEALDQLATRLEHPEWAP